jgi:hydroxymethylpyrimidine pyrophosphatase-like HAD family hydrolase
MAIKLIVSDVDGCMSPEESVAWSLNDFAELCRVSQAASRGEGTLPPMTLCTGRPQPYVEALLKVMDIRHPAICESGAILYDLASNRSRYGPGVTAQKIAGLRAVRCFVEDHVLPKFAGAVIQFGKEAQLSVYSEKPEIFAEVKEMVTGFVKAHGGPELGISASHYYLNISLAGVDKGSAIRHLLAMSKVDKQHTAGIGDTEGDLPLRNEVAFFACPANATRPVKEVADYISPYPALQGMLDILKHPCLQKA